VETYLAFLPPESGSWAKLLGPMSESASAARIAIAALPFEAYARFVEIWRGS